MYEMYILFSQVFQTICNPRCEYQISIVQVAKNKVIAGSQGEKASKIIMKLESHEKKKK